MSKRSVISVQIDGETHSGTVEIDGDIIRVTTPWGAKSLTRGRLPPEVRAEMLLRDLVLEQRLKGKQALGH
jgi:hypothetical protein